MKAIRHFRSRNVVLSTESPAEWEQLRKSFVDKCQPSGSVETDPTHQKVAAPWRQERTWTIESDTYKAALDAQKLPLPQHLQQTPAFRVAPADHGSSPQAKSLATLPRYEASLCRQFHRSLKTLLELLKLRAAGPLSVQPNELNPSTEQ